MEEQKKPQKKEVSLDEMTIRKIELENRQRALQISNMKLQLEEMEAFLEKGTKKKQAKARLDRIKGYQDTKKDDDGKDIPETDLEALEIQYSTLQKAYDQDLDTEKLRVEISQLREQLELQEKNYKVVEKQVRERKMTVIQ